MENKQDDEKLTAMEQLIHWIDSDCTPMDCIMKAKELLKVEKDQIAEAFNNSYWFIDGIEYYEKTYGK